MDNLVLFIVIVGLFAMLFYFFKDKIYLLLKSEEESLPFKRKEFLMNIPERKFFEELQKIIPGSHIVFPQVLLSSIVNVTSSRKDFWRYQNQINRKTVDYVIFEKPYFKPVIAIEYDGKTHNKPNRKDRDIKVKNILDSADIKSFHVEHGNVNFEEVKRQIEEITVNNQ